MIVNYHFSKTKRQALLLVSVSYLLDRRSFNEPIVGYCNACQDIKTHKDKYQDYCIQKIH